MKPLEIFEETSGHVQTLLVVTTPDILNQTRSFT